MKKYKSQIIKIAVLLLVLIAISGLVFGILVWTNVIQFDNGIVINQELFIGIKGEWWFYLVFFIIQITFTILLTFMPLGSMMFIVLGIALFGATWQTFLLVFGGVIASSLLMDVIGRFGGSKIVVWLIGQKDYDKALDLIKTKKYSYLPFMYLLPMFPDDALCMVAGMSKINFWYHLTVILLCRGVGTATIIFGINLVPYQNFTTFYEWFVLGGVLILYVSLLLKIANFIDKKLSKIIAKKSELDYNKGVKDKEPPLQK